VEIENESRHTLEDMRELVGVLREDSSDLDQWIAAVGSV